MINTLLMNMFMSSETFPKLTITSSSGETSKNNVSKGRTYLKAARLHAEQARTEMKHGIEAQETAEKSGNQHFIRIAHWHFERCSDKSIKAEKYFLAAQKIITSRKRREYCRLRAIEMNQLGARAHFLENTIFADNHLTIT